MERLWAGTPIGAHPRRRFASFAAVGKGGRPAGRNPARCGAPSHRALRASWFTEDGRPHGAAPTAIHGHFRDMAGGASPLPYGVNGETFPGGESAATEDRPYGVTGEMSRNGGRAATWGRSYGGPGGSPQWRKKHNPRHPFHEKRAWRGLITIKCMIMYHF